MTHKPGHEGMSVSELRSKLKEIRKKYYGPLSRMTKRELMEEHERHSGLMAGKTHEPETTEEMRKDIIAGAMAHKAERKAMKEPMPSASLEKKVKHASAAISSKKTVPGLPQAVGVAVGSMTQEGGKQMGEPPARKRKAKKVETDSSGMEDVPVMKKRSKKAMEPVAPAKKVHHYRDFVSKHRKMGHSMKEIGELYRRSKNMVVV
jgi:hypothetical protein